MLGLADQFGQLMMLQSYGSTDGVIVGATDGAVPGRYVDGAPLESDATPATVVVVGEDR